MLIQWKCKKTLFLYFIVLLWLIPLQIALAISFGNLPDNKTAIYVADLQTGQIIHQHRADIAINPASTMKLVTTFVTLQQLGPQYQWQTEWRSNAPIKNGVLQGNLYWYGSGNPIFDQRDLQLMLAQLQAKGIRQINGQLVLDRSIWSNIGSADNFAADHNEVFVTPPDPHMVSYRVWWLTITRDQQGRPFVTVDTPLPNITIQQHLSWQNHDTACPSVGKYVHAFFNGHTLNIQGKVPFSCLGKTWFINTNKLSAAEFATESFRTWWRQSNSDIKYSIGTLPQNTSVIASHQSKPLAEIITAMNKYSNNTIARTLFLSLGEKQKGDTVENAKTIVLQTLRQAHINTSKMQLENGSGLSRKERVTARLLGQLLQVAYNKPFAQEFINSLPIGGVDGTLRHRFKNTHGQWHLKTGTLNNVNALAGYWIPKSSTQHPLVIVAIVNAFGNHAADLDILARSLIASSKY